MSESPGWLGDQRRLPPKKAKTREMGENRAMSEGPPTFAGTRLPRGSAVLSGKDLMITKNPWDQLTPQDLVVDVLQCLESAARDVHSAYRQIAEATLLMLQAPKYRGPEETPEPKAESPRKS